MFQRMKFSAGLMVLTGLVELHASHEKAEELHHTARTEAKGRLRERINRLCVKECGSDPPCTQRISEIRIEEEF